MSGLSLKSGYRVLTLGAGYYLVILGGLLMTRPVLAQARSEMPLFLLEGNQYVRQIYDKDGRAQASQTIAVSRVTPTQDGFEIEIKITEDQTVSGSIEPVRTTIRCRAQDANMVMSLLLAGELSRKRTALIVTGGEIRYPRRPAHGDTLSDVRLEATAEGGLLGFLGGRSRIDLRDRIVQLHPVDGRVPGSTPYTIKEAIRIKVYTLGIKVRERAYRAEEIIAPERGLLSQILRSPDGSYTALVRIDDLDETDSQNRDSRP